MLGAQGREQLLRIGRSSPVGWVRALVVPLVHRSDNSPGLPGGDCHVCAQAHRDPGDLDDPAACYLALCEYQEPCGSTEAWLGR
jgi:hypothetical protein